jgi:hypothetical protein
MKDRLGKAMDRILKLFPEVSQISISNPYGPDYGKRISMTVSAGKKCGYR